MVFSINGNTYENGYYLADRIYPRWSAFVKTIPNPQDRKRAYFSKMQESLRKDVERAFGVLQARFQIIDKPCKLWNQDNMKDIITACVILHNMIVEDERDDYTLTQRYLIEDPNRIPIDLSPASDIPHSDHQIRSTMRGLYDQQRHDRLQNDLVEHLWAAVGDDSE